MTHVEDIDTSDSLWFLVGVFSLVYRVWIDELRMG